MRTLPQPTASDSMSFVIEGEVSVQVMITELSDGTLQFDLETLDGAGSVGDLSGLFFDYLEPDLVAGLSATGDDISGQSFQANGVTKVGPGNNIKGEIGQDPFDCGVSFGRPGKGHDDDIQETSFVLSHAEYDLSLEDFEAMDFAVRLTSVGAEDGSREGSLKLDGQAPSLIEENPRDTSAEEEPATEDPVEEVDPGTLRGIQPSEPAEDPVLPNSTGATGSFDPLAELATIDPAEYEELSPTDDPATDETELDLI